jgi:hypothetical protein
VIYPRWRQFAFAFDFGPGEGRFGDVEHPAVVDAFVSDVASEDDEVGFGVG